jgi:hypothetical protein
LPEALVEIRRASEAGRGNPDVDYQAAVIHVLARDLSAAFQDLGRAVQSGYPSILVDKDPEFSNLRRDKRFTDALSNGNNTAL